MTFSVLCAAAPALPSYEPGPPAWMADFKDQNESVWANFITLSKDKPYHYLCLSEVCWLLFVKQLIYMCIMD